MPTDMESPALVVRHWQWISDRSYGPWQYSVQAPSGNVKGHSGLVPLNTGPPRPSPSPSSSSSLSVRSRDVSLYFAITMLLPLVPSFAASLGVRILVSVVLEAGQVAFKTLSGE
jgi:hypothetical protein